MKPKLYLRVCNLSNISYREGTKIEEDKKRVCTREYGGGRHFFYLFRCIVLLASLQHNVSFCLTNCNHVQCIWMEQRQERN